MNISEGAVAVITRTADATAAAAGAVGGAAVNGVIGGIQGAATGVKSGLSRGSHSTPAAALTLAAIGAAGLVDWPVLLGVGGTALVVRQLGQRSSKHPAPDASGDLEPDSESDRTPRRGDEAVTPARKSAASSRRSPSMG
ncbi:hypothetical protein OHA40_01225 [Nocardia sp. NBC_00508]|uniref:hypothetical protein n=1 Tax=Nocardia sp. NBC_00508 TaxID=2975992 RepID=UPI002E80F11D|nr:hypothetical protein [Nocardia sp. NBC_00508]WUD66823.1 hypothetical protein OHA40_01225 [Nocardia sp. NBC_00508]